MNQVVTTNPFSLVQIIEGRPVTTSVSIAEGVGNTHRSVIQLIRQYIDDVEEFGRVAFQIAPFETSGGVQNREIALLNEQQATLLLTYLRNNEVVRAFKIKLVKAFYEFAERLRNQPVIPQELSRMDILEIAMQSEKERIRIEAEKKVVEDKLLVAEPKAAALDRIAAAKGSMNLSTAAKTLKVPPRKLIAYLISRRWLFKSGPKKTNTAYQDKINAGCLEHSECIRHNRFGEEFIILQPLVTPKGLVKIAELLEKDPM